MGKKKNAQANGHAPHKTASLSAETNSILPQQANTPATSSDSNTLTPQKPEPEPVNITAPTAETTQSSSMPPGSNIHVPVTPEALSLPGISCLNLSDKQRGALEQQTKTREQIKAERAAKKANKANSKANAANKEKPQPVVQHEKQQQSNASPSKPSTFHDDAPITSTKLPSQKAPGKSALRGKDAPRANREVQFDLAAVVVGSPTAESHSTVRQEPIVTESLTILAIHPSFIKLLVKCEHGVIVDIDELCIQFIKAFQEFLENWWEEQVDSGASINDAAALSAELDMAIRPQIAYLKEDGRWPLPYALGNIVRQMKKEIKRLGTEEPLTMSIVYHSASYSSHKSLVYNLNLWLEDLKMSHFVYAAQAISNVFLEHLKNTTCIVLYGWCPIISQALTECIKSERFKLKEVIVIDRQANGKALRYLDPLLSSNLHLQYGDLSALSTALPKASLCLIGCSTVFSNGSIVVERGGMLVALAAERLSIPLITCAQTIKFVDKVTCFNRVALLGREEIDVVPSRFISGIVTELRLLPATSAPSILKAKSLEA